MTAVVELDQFKSILDSYDETISGSEGFTLTWLNKEQRIEELERKMEEPDFWDDPERSQQHMKKLSDLKEDVATYKQLQDTVRGN